MKRAKLFVLLTGFAVAAPVARTGSLELIKDESSVTYHLVHPLHKIEATSKEVQYALDADVTSREIKSVSAQVDVTTFDSGNSNRDSHAMEVIDAISFPEVNFSSASVVQNGDSVYVMGKLTFHGVTKDVVIAGTSTWSGNKLVLRGGFDVSLTAFKIDRPSLLLIPVEDVLSFDIVAAFGWK